MARQRNNIFAIAADAVDLALDTAGTMGNMVGGIASLVGIGPSGKEKSEGQVREEANDAADRVATSLRQEAEAAMPRAHKAKAAGKRVVKTHSTKRPKSVAKRRAARKAA